MATFNLLSSLSRSTHVIWCKLVGTSLLNPRSLSRRGLAAVHRTQLLCSVSAHDRSQIECDMLKLLRGCETGLQELQNAAKNSTPARGGPSSTQVSHCHGLVRSAQIIRLIGVVHVVPATQQCAGALIACSIAGSSVRSRSCQSCCYS